MHNQGVGIIHVDDICLKFEKPYQHIESPTLSPYNGGLTTW
jgi:hypothetical protein